MFFQMNIKIGLYLTARTQNWAIRSRNEHPRKKNNTELKYKNAKENRFGSTHPIS